MAAEGRFPPQGQPVAQAQPAGVFHAVRYVARTGGQRRYLPNNLPPWFVVYQQTQRWLRAGCLEMLVENVRSLLREWRGRKGQPTAVVIDSRTLQSTPESGTRAGYVFWIFPRVGLMLMAFLPIWVAMEGRPI